MVLTSRFEYCTHMGGNQQTCYTFFTLLPKKLRSIPIIDESWPANWSLSSWSNFQQPPRSCVIPYSANMTKPFKLAHFENIHNCFDSQILSDVLIPYSIQVLVDSTILATYTSNTQAFIIFNSLKLFSIGDDMLHGVQ